MSKKTKNQDNLTRRYTLDHMAWVVFVMLIPLALLLVYMCGSGVVNGNSIQSWVESHLVARNALCLFVAILAVYALILLWTRFIEKKLPVLSTIRKQIILTVLLIVTTVVSLIG